jgi:FixJ family two-component response regulator
MFVVDDEEAVRKSLSRLLAAIGVPTETFPSAVAFLSSYGGDKPGCLLVDLRMPGMSGLDLMEELKRQPLGFLEKPFSLAALRAIVERWRSTFPA